MQSPRKLRPLKPKPEIQVITLESGIQVIILEQPQVTENEIEKKIEHIQQIKEADKLRGKNRRKMNLKSLANAEVIQDDLAAKEILSQAQGAGKSVADKVSMKRVGSKMGSLRQKKDGTTSLQIIIPGDGVIPGTNQRPVSLGQLFGKIGHGTGSLQVDTEDKRNLAKPIKPLDYGAYGSHAPIYDSTFANLTKEESDLIYNTYGYETAMEYNKSKLHIAEDCNNAMSLSPPTKKCKIDVGQLKTLSDIGIDTTFLDNLAEKLKTEEEYELRKNQLDTTSNLIINLGKIQHNRLSAPLPSHYGNIQKASELENSLARKVTEDLTNIAKKLPPSAIASIDGLRKAMGIGLIDEPEPMDVEAITRNPNVESITNNPNVESITNNPNVESITNNPNVESITNNPNVESITNNPNVESITNNPNVESITNNPNVESITNNPNVESITQNLNVESKAHNLVVESITQNLNVESKAHNSVVKSITHNSSIVTENITLQEAKSEENNILPVQLSLDLSIIEQVPSPVKMEFGQKLNVDIENTLNLKAAASSNVDAKESELREYMENLDNLITPDPIYTDEALIRLLSEP